MSDLTRKDFLKLTTAAVATGVMATTGLGSVARVQSSDLLHRKIHSTGEMIPAVGLGTAMTFGDLSEDFNQRKNAIAALFREGATVIDTSPTYSDAEQVVGMALDELGLREQCFLATKISIRGKQAGIDQNNKSFEDLRTNKMELLQVHNLRDTDAHLETINGLREEGKVKYVGITHFRDSQNDDAAKVIENNKIDFIQCHYNLLDQTIENRVLPAAREHGQ